MVLTVPGVSKLPLFFGRAQDEARYFRVVQFIIDHHEVPGLSNDLDL